MSQKTKRTRRLTDEEQDSAFKVPGASKGQDEGLKSDQENGTETNGFKETADLVENGTESPKRVIQTRSRSSTPLSKCSDKGGESGEENKNRQNGQEDEYIDKEDQPEQIEKIQQELNESGEEEKSETPTEEKQLVNGDVQDSPKSSSKSPDMEPLVLENDQEETIPELQFDENEFEVESEGSPSRCKTRRSQSRNISTPKTPKLLEQELDPKVFLDRLNDDEVSGKSTPGKPTSSNVSVVDSDSQPGELGELDNLDTSDTYSSVSTDNLSTKVVVGSDVSRNATDLSHPDSGLFEDNSVGSQNRSLGDTMRNLSPRRTIRPISSDYRKLAMRNSIDINAGLSGKNDQHIPYEPVEQVTGIKRKNRSCTPEDPKRFKQDFGLLSFISRPFISLKNNYYMSSTPKLVAYVSKKAEFEEHVTVNAETEIANGSGPRKWCSIM